jgi:glucosamine-6-phosphate deaminase
MEIVVVPPEEVARVGARLVRDALATAGRPAPTLMPALGMSALALYVELGALRVAGELDASRLGLIQLDEYVGVAEDDPRSLYAWLRRDVAEPLEVSTERIIRLGSDALARSPGEAACARACRDYDDAVAAAGGLDVAVLGLGPNGHVGFNEPPSARDASTREVSLAPESLASSARYWAGLSVPATALTAGMATILAARRILLVVTGSGKRAILRRMLVEPVGERLPASWLRPLPAATLLADDGAWPPDVPRP